MRPLFSTLDFLIISAFLGLVPRQSSSGGKVKLGGISKMGDRYLRHLLVSGAAALLSHAKTRRGPLDVWAPPPGIAYLASYGASRVCAQAVAEALGLL